MKRVYAVACDIKYKTFGDVRRETVTVNALDVPAAVKKATQRARKRVRGGARVKSVRVISCALIAEAEA